MTETLMVPTVHMNGTARADLQQQLADAIDAVHATGKALAKACPNGRDYYPQGSGAINTALDQHEHRMGLLKEVVTELETMLEAVS
jgi:hypothetical protein